MAPSWVSTSISMFLKSQKAFLLALEPLSSNLLIIVIIIIIIIIINK